MVNTSVLDLESAVDVLVFAPERKAQRLSTPTGELGPATGLARYPGEPGDFRPPEHMSDLIGLV